MKKLLTLFIVVCFSSTLFSQTIVSTTPTDRNAILEEFTGKTCPYCPDGHKRAQQLMNNYPDRFFAINIHQGMYATGTPNYTTPYGNALAAKAGMGASGTGYPGGTVNRQAFENVAVMGSSQYLYDRGKWGSCAYYTLNEPSCLNVAAKGRIDTVVRRLDLLVEVYYTGDAEELTNKLTVAMLQNEILGPQSGASQWYPEMLVDGQYRHMHMLRDFVTGTQWGMDVTPTTTGTFWSHNFVYDIPEKFNNIPVVLANLEFIVFVAENETKIITGADAEIEFGVYYTSQKIMASAGENGTISPIGEKIYIKGEKAEYKFTPKKNYKVDEVLIDGEPIELEQPTSYTFPSVDKDYTIHVTFKPIVGIDEIQIPSISIAPNPVTDKLFITGMYDKLEIFSISGQLITTEYNNPEIEVTHLLKGFYVVKIHLAGEVHTCKFVK